MHALAARVDVGSWVEGFRVDRFWAGVLGAIVYSVISWILSALLLRSRD
jgi:putative membrane protein